MTMACYSRASNGKAKMSERFGCSYENNPMIVAIFTALNEQKKRTIIYSLVRSRSWHVRTYIDHPILGRVRVGAAHVEPIAVPHGLYDSYVVPAVEMLQKAHKG